MSISGTTKVIGILGYPVEHSLSPAMQNAAFGALHLDYVYLPFAVPPAALRSAVKAVRTLGLRGVNITVPHKEKVLCCLDRLDPLAEKTGSVNTIVNENGVLTGYTTDCSGFLQDLKVNGIRPARRSILLLGAGGAAHAAAFALASAGAGTIRIAARNRQRGRALAARIDGAEYIPFDQLQRFTRAADIIVNATSLGMRPDDPSPLAARDIAKDCFVYDMIYNRPTALAVQAKKAGARYCPGTGMLLYQGAYAFELWTKRKAPVEVMRRALLKALKQK